jgi:hypothetical protein
MNTFEEYIKLNDSVDQFIQKVYSLGKKKRSGATLRVGGASVYVEFVSFNKIAHLSEISIPNEMQQQGIGHKVMNIITKLADEYQVKLGLFPSPISQGPGEEQISKPKLVNFYKQHGFVSHGATMERIPEA